MKRLSFFKAIAAAIGIIALAPQLAFRAKPPKWQVARIVWRTDGDKFTLWEACMDGTPAVRKIYEEAVGRSIEKPWQGQFLNEVTKAFHLKLSKP